MKNMAKRLQRFEERLLVLTLLGLAAVAFVQVCTRYLFGVSFDWFEEGGRYAGVFVTFLGAGIGARRKVHFTMDAFVSSLPGPVARVIRLLVGLASAVCFWMVAWYAFQLVVRNWRFGVTSAAIGVPMYLVYLTIPVFSIVTGLRFAASALTDWRESR